MKKLVYPNIKDIYTIDEYGNIIDNNGNQLKPYLNDKGYLKISLRDILDKSKTLSVHILVAYNFIAQIRTDNVMTVNHKDGNKLNCHYSNLEYITRSENVKHAYNTGLNSQTGMDNNLALFDDVEIHAICAQLEKGKAANQFYKRFPFYSKDQISDVSKRIIHNGAWSHISKNYNLTKFHRHSGENNHASKITEDMAHHICQRLSDSIPITQIAYELSLSRYIISDIKRRKTWREVSKDYSW